MTNEEYKQWLEDHAKMNKDKAEDQTKSQRITDFHLGARLAFEMALEKFKELK